jgi:hypothetical protein
MATYIAIHEVDDIDHWASSPKRSEVFGKIGVSHRIFRADDGSNQVAVILEVPDMAALQEVLGSEEGAEAMRHDGVRPETLRLLAEG